VLRLKEKVVLFFGDILNNYFEEKPGEELIISRVYSI
jgi:hypothetical protein